MREAHLINSHKLFSGVLSGLSERGEFDILWPSCLVSEGWLQGIKVVCADSNELTPPTDVLMQLILQVDKRRVGSLCEVNTAQDRARKERSDLLCLQIILVCD